MSWQVNQCQNRHKGNRRSEMMSFSFCVLERKKKKEEIPHIYIAITMKLVRNLIIR